MLSFLAGRGLLAAMLLPTAGFAKAQLPITFACGQPSIDKGSPFDFMDASIEALAQAKKALGDAALSETERQPPQGEVDAVTLLTAMMLRTKLASDDYKCAESLVNAYTDSSDKNIKLAANELAAAYKAHLEVNNLFLASLIRMPNSGKQRADIWSSLEAARERDWKALKYGTVAVLLCTIDLSRPDKNGIVRHLRLTQQQRATLTQRLIDLFPDLKRPAQRKSWNKPTEIANLYLIMLTESKYKCADEP